MKTLSFPSLEQYVRDNSYEVRQQDLDDSGWSLAEETKQKLLMKLKGFGVPLGEYVSGKIFRGVLTGLNEAFVIDEATRARLIAEDARSAELIKPFLAGRDIKRYEQPRSDKYLIFTRHGLNIDDYPAIRQYLTTFKEKLTPKPKNWAGKEWKGRKPGAYEWYEIQDTIDYHAEFEKPKIVYAEIAARGQFTLDLNYSYYDTTAYIMVKDTELAYLLGLFNSKLWSFVFSNTSSTIRGGFYRWKRQYMSPLPICTIDFSDLADVARHDRMVELVQTMLDLHKALSSVGPEHERTILARRIEATDRQIDRLVYELYSPTEE